MKSQQWFRGEAWLVMHDPISLAYFYFSAHEQFVIEQLDGVVSIDQLRERFDRRFPPYRLTVQQVSAFLEQLHKQGLVSGTLPGQGEVQIARSERRQQWPISRVISAVLSPRLRGFNPDTWLRPWLPYVSWFFSRTTATVLLTLVAILFALALTQLPALLGRLESPEQMLRPEHLMWLPVMLMLVKTLHELGHAFVCLRLGGRVPEMGVQLLLLTPCLYCNVSDSWLFPSRWRRMAVAAAGMYVELVLAALFGILWWLSVPGVINSMALQGLVICSIGTLIVNGNPLLRYDGYYLLSDWLEIPNLESRSRKSFETWFGETVFGLKPPPLLPTAPRRDRPLAFYALFSGIYRIWVLIAAYWLLSAIGRAWRIEPIAQGIVVLTAVATLYPLVTSFYRQWREAIMRRQFQMIRFSLAMIVAAGAIALVCVVPLPNRIDAPLVITPLDATPVYVTASGQLRSCLAAGTRVKQGDTIATLENSALRVDRARIDAQLLAQQKRLDALSAMRGIDESADAAIPAETEVLLDLRDRAAQLKQLTERLTIAAPRDGVLLAPPKRAEDRTRIALTQWYGTPLDRENLGSYLEEGTLLCEIGEPDQLEAMAMLDESDLEQVRVGQSAAVMIDQLDRVPLDASIIDIARASENSEVQTMVSTLQPDDRSPGEVRYRVRLELAQQPAVLPYAGGKGRIRVDAETVASRLWRLFSRTFQLSRDS